MASAVQSRTNVERSGARSPHSSRLIAARSSGVAADNSACVKPARKRARRRFCPNVLICSAISAWSVAFTSPSFISDYKRATEQTPQLPTSRLSSLVSGLSSLVSPSRPGPRALGLLPRALGPRAFGPRSSCLLRRSPRLGPWASCLGPPVSALGLPSPPWASRLRLALLSWASLSWASGLPPPRHSCTHLFLCAHGHLLPASCPCRSCVRCSGESPGASIRANS
jgi:hypothetical protein